MFEEENEEEKVDTQEDSEIIEEYKKEDEDVQLRDLIRYPNAIKILRFLNIHKVSFARELKRELNIQYGSARHVLKRFLKEGIVSEVHYPQSNVKYVKLNESFPTEKLITKYDKHFTRTVLKPLIPNDRFVTIEEMNKIPKWRANCVRLGIDPKAVFDILRNDNDIEVEEIKEYPYAAVIGYRIRNKKKKTTQLKCPFCESENLMLVRTYEIKPAWNRPFNITVGRWRCRDCDNEFQKGAGYQGKKKHKVVKEETPIDVMKDIISE